MTPPLPSGARVLVLGGTGFLGRHTVRALQARGHHAVVLARGHRHPLPNVEIRVADRADPVAMSAALAGERFDATLDLSAYDAPHLAPLRGVALGRYVLVSTGQIYLATTDHRAPHREEQAEAPLRPEPEGDTSDHASWIYGTGKRRAEAAAIALSGSSGISTTILRIPSVLGEEDGSLRLWAYLERLLDGGPILLPDGGRRPIRTVYVGDVVEVLLRLVEGLTPRETAYNLSQPDPLPLRELVERLAERTGRAPVLAEAEWEAIEAAGIDPGFSPLGSRGMSRLDPSRAEAEWGFRGTPIAVYLPRVVDWHLAHRPPSHPGYAERAKELAFIAALAQAG